jgi:three-Cys-motif partner protein
LGRGEACAPGSYIDISRGARRKFAIGPSRTATYIDLFSGAGRARVRGTSRIIDGSPLVAYRAAVASEQAFTEIHLADADPALRLAAAKRIVAAGGSAIVHAGSAEDVVAEMVGQLNPHGLHFAFLDPFNLGALSLSVISELARLERMDMLVHVSAMDLRRNVRQNLEENADSFDRFAPGWRDAVGEDGNDRTLRRSIFQHWLNCIRRLGMKASDGVEIITADGGQELYWLVFIARHALPDKFWNAIRNVSPQGRLSF